MTAKLQCVVLDCADVRALSRFYQALLAGALNQPDPRWLLGDRWATLHLDGGAVLAFQQVDGYRPPHWPDPDRPQQIHLDVTVSDLDQAEADVLERGAALLDAGDGRRGWRIFADPAGHPFCLVLEG